MFEVILLITILIVGISVVSSFNLMRSVIYSGVFSLLMAIAYLYYNAPDVALAEATIGVALSTIMYMVALKKVRTYSFIYVDTEADTFDDVNIREVFNTYIKPLEDFIESSNSMDPRISYTNKSLDYALNTDHDVIIFNEGGTYNIYGDSTDSVFQEMVSEFIDIYGDSLDNINVIFKDQGVESNES